MLKQASNEAAAVSYSLSKGWPGRSSIARVERAHSYRARSASRRTTRLPFPSFFNSLLELVLRHAIPERIPGDLEEPACFGNIPACALQRFF